MHEVSKRFTRYFDSAPYFSMSMHIKTVLRAVCCERKLFSLLLRIENLLFLLGSHIFILPTFRVKAIYPEWVNK